MVALKQVASAKWGGVDNHPHQDWDIRTPLHQACKCFGILVGTESIWWPEVDVAQYDVKSAVITDDYQH